MRKNSIVLFLFVLSSYLMADYTNPVVQWGIEAGSANDDTGYSVISDDNGYTYIAGQFSGTAEFGSTELTSYGSKDIFIAKLDTNGTYLWAVKAGGTKSDNANALSFASNGNLLVTGVFEKSADFDNENLTSNGAQDAFVAEYTTAGSCVWAKSYGGDDSDLGKSIAVDDAGNLYLSGHFQKTADFGNSVTLTAIGFQEAFLAKLDDSGNCLWAKQVEGGSSEVSSGDITAVSGERVYMTGTFFGDADFGNGNNLTSKTSIDVFLAKYDTSGICRNVGHYYGNTASDYVYPYGLSLRNEKIAISGFFVGSLVIAGEDTLQGEGNEDAFFFVKDTSGNYDIIKHIGSQGYDNASKIFLTNKVFVSGSFTNTIDFASDTSVTSAGGQDMFVAVYDYLGNFEGVKTYGSQEDDYITSMYADDNNLGYITGAFTDSLSLNDSTGIKSPGGESVFTIKMNLVPIVINTIDYQLKSGWNYISANVIPEDASLEAIFDSVKNDVSIVKNFNNEIYIPDLFINSIGDLNVSESYMVYAGAGTDFSITGEVVDPLDYTLNLNEGWNFVPYLKNEEAAIETVLMSISDKVVVVLDPSGNIWIPGDLNTIGNMKPGEAYRIYSKESVSFTYPSD